MEVLINFFSSDIGLSVLLVSIGIFGGIKRYFPVLREIIIEAYGEAALEAGKQRSK